MKLLKRFNRILPLFFSGLLILPADVLAGFLDMPEIVEMPELERKSMLKDLDIPTVRDRDPDPDSGPRLNVLKFKLQGIVEFPELGISKADVDKLIEDIRYELMDEYRVEESGFTKKEVEDVSKLLGDIEEETMERHVSELEVQKLVWLIREQRSNRGITLDTIETVADRITQFYRERGFILAKAYIPQQEVRDGVVTLTLLLGVLGEVEVSGNEVYDSDYLASSFDDILTKPITSVAIEEELYLINDYPGIAATGYFSPGAQVGDTRLNVNVKSERAYDINLRADNHGSEQTGRYRLYGEVFWNNPLGNADQLHVAGLVTGKPSNTTYGLIRYSSRVFSPRFSLSAGASSNDFILGTGTSDAANKLGITGKTFRADVTASYRFKRSRTQNYYGDFIYEKIESRIRLKAIPDEDFLDDIVANKSLVFRFDVLDEGSKMLHQANLKYTNGDFVKGVEVGQDENYDFFNIDYSLLTFWRLPYFNANTRIIYRANMQYSGIQLTSVNQFLLAGPTRARGYSVNQFSADDAVYMGLDWMFDAPAFMDMPLGSSNLRNILQPFVFMDIAYGEGQPLLSIDEKRTAQLFDAGIGIQFSYINKFTGNFQLAFPINEQFSGFLPDQNIDSVRLVFDMQYIFR